MCFFSLFKKERGSDNASDPPGFYLPLSLVYEKIFYYLLFALFIVRLEKLQGYQLTIETKLRPNWVKIAKGMLKIVKE